MTNEVSAKTIGCPYCGEHIDVIVDGSLPEQEYVEDCPVCCRPHVLRIFIEPDGHVTLQGEAE